MNQRTASPWARILSVPLAVGLAITPASVAEAEESDTEEQSLIRPDIVSASTTARAVGKPVEDMSGRTGSTTRFANPDGSVTYTDFGGEFQVQDKETGAWSPVDYTLVEQPDGSLAPRNASLDLKIGAGDSNLAAQVGFEGDDALSVEWPDKLPEPTVDGGVATYAVSDSTDLVVSVTGAGATVRVIFKKRPSIEERKVALSLVNSDDVEVEQTSRGLVVSDEDGDALARTGPLIAWDSQVDSTGEPKNVVPVTSSLEEGVGVADEEANAWNLTAPDAFLDNPRTVYPVTVDPDLTLAWVRSTFVREGDTYAHHTDHKLLIGDSSSGNPNKPAYSFVQFDTSPIAGKTVLKAELGLYQYFTNTCADRQMSIHAVSAAWTGPITYSNMPGISGANATAYTKMHAGSSCADRWIKANVKGIVSAWAQGAPNYGFRLSVPAAAATDQSYERRLCSLIPNASNPTCNSASRRPYLKVTVDGPPSTPPAPTLSPATSAGTTLWTTSQTPTFSAPVSDPEGNAVRIHLKIKEGSVVKFDGFGVTTASGGISTKQLPSANALVDGHTYTAQVWANDTTSDSTAGSPAVTFKVDSTAPSKPTVSCSGVTSGTWYTTRPSDSTDCTITADASAETVEWTRNNKPMTPLRRVSGSFVTGTQPIPEDGVAAMSFRARDQAGNISPAVEFGFGTGHAGVVTPVEGERTSSTVTVEAAAPAGAAFGRLEFRPSGDDSANWTVASKVVPSNSSLTWTGTVTDTSLGTSSTGQLVWDLSRESGIDTPSMTDFRVCFGYSGITKCTDPRPITLVPHAFGGAFPTADIGPGQVSMVTGELQVGGIDVDVSAMGESISIGRSHRTLGGASTAAAGVFGPGWVADLSGPETGSAAVEVVDRSADDGSITLIDADGESSTYQHLSGEPNAQAPGIYAGDLESEEIHDLLVITADGSAKNLTLLADDGTATVWEYIGSSRWAVKQVVDPTETSKTRFEHNASGLVTAIIAPTPTGVSCTTTSQAPGCRILFLNYSTIAGSQRLTSVDLRTFDPKPSASTGLPTSAAGMVTITVMKYAYDASGRLEAAWDPRLGDGASALKTRYEYQSIGSKTLLAKLTPPGVTPWRMDYDDAARLKHVKRENPSTAGGGDATWSVAYEVPLSASGLPDLTSTEVKKWGQAAAPVGATAVFGPDRAVGDQPSSDDWRYASVSYFDNEGRSTNDASFGAGAWQVESSAFDANGNEVWTLDAGNRNMALQAGGNTEAVANSLAEVAVFSADGARVESRMGPTRQVVLKDGSVVFGRDYSETTYDDEAAPELVPGRPVPDPDSKPQNLIVEQVDAIMDANGQIFDRERTRYRYDPVDSSDGNGWELGAPTQVLEQNGSGWATTSVRFDQEGKTRESRSAQANESSLTTANARATKVDYYTADATGGSVCGNRPEWAGLQCRTYPAAQPGGGAPLPTTAFRAYDYLQNATLIEESAGSMTRTTVLEFETSGRPSSSVTTLSGTTSSDRTLPKSTTAYSSTTGAVTGVTAGDVTETTAYDGWGRAISQSDGRGNVGTTTYDDRGRIASAADGKGTYTFTYDGTDAAGKEEHRGLVTAVDAGLASGPDQFQMASDADGSPYLVKLPNGMTKETTYDASGVSTAVTYRKADGSQLFAFSGTFDADGRARSMSSPLSSQKYAYDDLDRLKTVEDTTAAGCVVRTYEFSLDSNRTALQTSGLNATGCSSEGNSTLQSTFDDGDRLTDSGYTYDDMGRTRSTPVRDTDMAGAGSGGGAAAGDLQLAYYANDMVAKLTQNVPDDLGTGTIAQTNAYGLDASERISTIQSFTAGANLREVTNHYSGDSDSPAWITTKVRMSEEAAWTESWSRFIAGPDGGMSLIESSDGTSKIQITNLHDDVVAQVDNSTTFTGVEGYTETTEYGITRGDTPAFASGYGWLGAHQRSFDTVGGLSLMGARLYNPRTGRFLTTDPISGGNDNAYTYPPDPVNSSDLTGEWGSGFSKFVKKVKKKLSRAAKRVKKAVKKAYRSVKKTVKKAAKAVSRAVKHVAKKAKRTARTVHDHVKRVAKSSKAKVKRAVKVTTRQVKKAVQATSRAAKVVNGHVDFLNDGFRVAEKFSKIGDAALIGYLVVTRDWSKAGKAIASVAAGIVAGAACTALTGGAGLAVGACFVVGAAASALTDHALA